MSNKIINKSTKTIINNSIIEKILLKLSNIINKKNISNFQIIIICIIILVIVIIIIIILLNNYLYDKSEGANKILLKLNNNIPFLSLINEKYMCMYAKYLTKYYPELLNINNINLNNIKNKNIQLKIINNFPIQSVNSYNHNYNMWLYISTSTNSLNNYLISEIESMTDNKKIIDETFRDYRINEQKQMIFSRGHINDCWPMIYLDEKYRLCSLFRKLLNINENGNSNIDEKSFVLVQRLPLNSWFNLNVQINNNIISVYINSKLEISKNIDLPKSERLQNKQIKDIYFYSNRNTLNNDGFTGYLNNFYYYNKILTVDDIKKIYKNNIPTFKKLNIKAINNQNTENSEIYNQITNTISKDYNLQYLLNENALNNISNENNS